MKISCKLFAGVLAGVPLASGVAPAAARYTIQDLGAAPRPAGNTPQGRGYAVNDGGLVVGSSNVNNPQGNTYPYRFDGGPSAVPTPNGSTYGFARGVNNSGAITGYASPSGGNTRAFVATGSATREIGTLTGSQFSYGYAINASGAVAGYYNGGASGTTRGFTWNPATNAFTELGTIQGTASSRGLAYGLNDAGVAVGNSDYSSAVRHATIYNTTGTLVDLGAIAAGQGFGSLTLASTAYAVSPGGLVAGAFNATASVSDPFVYDPAANAFRNLGLPTGTTSATAYAVNDAGVVVGTSSGSQGGAFVADGTGIYSLYGLVDNAAPTNFVDLVEAHGINVSGQITGWGDVLQTDGSTQYHAFLLTPTAVPEPAATGVVGLAAIGLLKRRWRRA